MHPDHHVQSLYEEITSGCGYLHGWVRKARRTSVAHCLRFPKNCKLEKSDRAYVDSNCTCYSLQNSSAHKAPSTCMAPPDLPTVGRPCRITREPLTADECTGSSAVLTPQLVGNPCELGFRAKPLSFRDNAWCLGFTMLGGGVFIKQLCAHVCNSTGSCVTLRLVKWLYKRHLQGLKTE